MSELHVVRRGSGRRVLFVHGSAADHTTWVMQTGALAGELECIAYDRRGSGASPPAPAGITVADHAADAAALIEELGGPVLGVGSSFGAVCVLELARTRPELLSGAVLCEPPLPCADDLPRMPAGFGCMYEAEAALHGGPAAGEMFMRLVVGDDVFERMPERWRTRACGEWRQIRADSSALERYRLRYRELRSVKTPMLLVGGARSNPYFDPTLEQLALSLPKSRRLSLAGGHMMHAESARAFNDELRRFAGVDH